MLIELGSPSPGVLPNAGPVAPMNIPSDPPTDDTRLRTLFESLVETYSDKVFRLAFALLGNEAAAQDATQEVFLKVWKALPRYHEESSGSSWIYTIARNTCLTELQRGKSKSSQSLSDEAIQAEVDRNHQEQITTPASMAPEELQSLLAELPEHFCHVLKLYYMEQRSYEEVARMMNLPMGTVKTHLHRAKKLLARLWLQKGISHEC